MLSHMQALTVLHLECALPYTHGFLSGGAFSVSLKVTLLCLTCLFICTPLSTAVWLLSCIDSPLKTQVRLEIESEDKSSINDYNLLPSLLTQRFSKSKDLSSTLAIHSFIISFSFRSEFTLSASECDDNNSDLSPLYPPQDCDIPLMIHFPMGHPITINNKVCVVGDICCSVPSTHVQTLHVVNPSFAISYDFWRKTLGHLDGLWYMKLSYGCMPDLASLLTLPADSVGEDATSDHDLTPSHIFAPRLEELELYCITFSPRNN